MRSRTVLLTISAVVLVVLAVLTLGPQPFGEHGWLSFILVAIRDVDPTAWRVIRGPGEFVANVLLFVPVGLVLVLLLGARRWWLALALSVAGSFGIEFVQESLPNRISDGSDVVANSVGAAVGVVLGVLISRRRAARDRRVPATDRSPAAPGE